MEGLSDVVGIFCDEAAHSNQMDAGGSYDDTYQTLICDHDQYVKGINVNYDDSVSNTPQKKYRALLD